MTSTRKITRSRRLRPRSTFEVKAQPLPLLIDDLKAEALYSKCSDLISLGWSKGLELFQPPQGTKNKDFSQASSAYTFLHRCEFFHKKKRSRTDFWGEKMIKKEYRKLTTLALRIEDMENWRQRKGLGSLILKDAV